MCHPAGSNQRRMSRNQRGQRQDLGRLIRVPRNGKYPPHHYTLTPLCWSYEAHQIQKPRECLTKFRSRNSWEPSISISIDIVATPWSPTWECLETLCTGTSAPGSWEWDLCHHTVKDMERETLSQRFTECAPQICSIITYFHCRNVCFAFKCRFKRRSLFSVFTLSFTVITLCLTPPPFWLIRSRVTPHSAPCRMPIMIYCGNHARCAIF